MANTALLTAVAQMLMQGRPQNPLAPVPGGPMTPPGGTFPGLPAWTPPPVMPEPAPVAPAPALDQNLIAQLTGPRPVAPVEQPVSLLQKIALALQGFGAGVQGQGPQFLAGLQEQRERPMREFQAQTEAFEDRRRRATVFAEEKQRRGQQDIQRQADIQSAREFQTFEMGERDRMQEAKDLRTQARQLEIEDRRAKAEAQRELAREQRELEREAKAITNQYFNLTKNRPLSEELGRFHSGLSDKPLSAAAAKLDAQLQSLGQVQMQRSAKVGSGTRGGASSGDASKLVEEFENLKRQLYPARSRGDETAVNSIMRRIEAVGSKLQAKGYEVGYGKNPYQKPPGTAQPTAQAAAPQNNDPLGIR